MERVVLLLSVLSLGVSSQSITESQRQFSSVVSRVQHIHMVAQKLLADYESGLPVEAQRTHTKIFLRDICQSDDIDSPIDKHETQRSSVLKLLYISYQLVECWEAPSRFLPTGLAQRNQISPKLSDLKFGIHLLITANQDPDDAFPDFSYGSYYQSLGAEDSPTQMYERLACFKKDMHKVETYLTVAKCRLSPETNCTL